MKNALRLGIVGCGDIAGYTAWFARLNRRIQLVACCDLSAERVEHFAGRFKIPHTYTSYERLLAQEELDAVYLATPHHLHHQMLIAAIQAGLHVLVEKPITHTLEEGTQVVRLAEEMVVLQIIPT